MNRRSLFVATATFLFAFSINSSSSLPAQTLALTPPMGWSEWDAYGLTVTESDFKANAEVLAELRQYGWQYALIDAGWYMKNPEGVTKDDKGYVVDEYGRLIPVANRFPSAMEDAGFKPLADWLHARGLKFGIHVMLGIPRQAVSENTPIAGSALHAIEAADTAHTCSWDSEFYVARNNAAGQAYYDSIMRLYAGWGVDYIKLGCVGDHPFHSSEIRQVAVAIKRSHRPVVLSLSPGPLPPEYLKVAAQDAQLWRFSSEHWDFWSAPPDKSSGYPTGLRDDFDLFEKWSLFVKPGNWADGDALPSGWLGPHPGWGIARRSRENADEQRSEFTLWVFARAPLIMGANLTKLDEFTRSLMANEAVISINQKALESHAVNIPSADAKGARVWEAQIEKTDVLHPFIAFFNLNDKQVTLHWTWKQLGLTGSHEARDIWTHKPMALSEGVEVTLPPHGSTIYHVE